MTTIRPLHTEAEAITNRLVAAAYGSALFPSERADLAELGSRVLS